MDFEHESRRKKKTKTFYNFAEPQQSRLLDWLVFRPGPPVEFVVFVMYRKTQMGAKFSFEGSLKVFGSR